MVTALVTFLGAGAFLHIDATDKQEEGGEENGT